MPHCCKCGCLDNVGEVVTCEACTDEHAMAVKAMIAAVENESRNGRTFFHKDFVLVVIKELR